MQHDNSDDPFGFWQEEPTQHLKRTQVGTRSHTDTQSLPMTRMVPVVRSERARPVVAQHRPRNPLLTRIWVMAGVMALLVPVALSLRNDRPQVRASEVAGIDTVFVGGLPAPAPTEVAPTTLATTTLAVVAVPSTPPPTEAVVVAPAATEPSVTAATAAPVKKSTPKSTTSLAPAAPAPTVAQSADNSCASTYTIVSGDAWSSIASRAEVTMKALLAANSATTKTVLLPGKDICLPPGAVAPGPPSTKTPSTTQPSTTQPKPATTQPTTPPPTTAPASTQPPPPANTYSKSQAAQIIRDVWPDDLEDEAIRIATRESNLIPTVRNYCCYGLFQIYFSAHRSWLAGIGITIAFQLYDPQVNASAALTLYNRSGWAPWGLPATTTTTVA